MHPTSRRRLSHSRRCQRVKRKAISSRTIPGVPSWPCCRKPPKWQRTTAPAQWISPTNCRFNCAPRKIQLRAAEERARELEAEAAHFRDRAGRAEAWLLRIHNEVENTFFQKKDRESRQTPRQ